MIGKVPERSLNHAEVRGKGFFSMDTPIAMLFGDERFCSGIKRSLPAFSESELIKNTEISFRELRSIAAGTIPDGLFDAVEMLLYTLENNKEEEHK